MKGMRKNAKTAFASSVYEKIKKMAKKANVKVSIPRTCGRQTLRNNTNARTPVAYFRRAIFLSFLDNLLEQINTRFNGLSETALLGLLPIPANLLQLNESSQRNLFSIIPLICRPQAVRRGSWSCGSASGMLFCVNALYGLPSL